MDLLQFAQQAVAALVAAGVQVGNDMDEPLWQQAGNLKVNPGKIFLADYFALALSIHSGLPWLHQITMSLNGLMH